MRKIIRLTESDLTRLVKRVLNEQTDNTDKIKKCLSDGLQNIGKTVDFNNIPEICTNMISQISKTGNADNKVIFNCASAVGVGLMDLFKISGQITNCVRK